MNVPVSDNPSPGNGAGNTGGTDRRSMSTLRRLKEIARKGGKNSNEDPYWISRYIYRHLSIYFTWVAASVGLSANSVTLLSGVFMLAAAVCYGLPYRFAWLAGALLVQLYFILDHVDGELARFEHCALNKRTGMAGPFFDSACHPAEMAMMVALGLRLYFDLEAPWWLLLLLIIMLFPGGIGPWQRYCETLVGYARNHVIEDRASFPTRMFEIHSLATGGGPSSVGQTYLRRAVSWVLQTIGFPGYFVTLLVCTVLDVVPHMPTLSIGDREISYLLIWLIVRALHNAVAGAKSTLVYGRQLSTLRND